MWNGNETQKAVTEQYRSAWDKIFGSKPVEKVEQPVDTTQETSNNTNT